MQLFLERKVETVYQFVKSEEDDWSWEDDKNYTEVS